MKTPNLSPIVEEFIKSDPVAWDAMCAHHSATALGIIMTVTMMWMILLALAALGLYFVIKKKDPEVSAPVLSLCFAGVFCMAIATMVVFPDALGTYVAPERDAMADVIRLSKYAADLGPAEKKK